MARTTACGEKSLVSVRKMGKPSSATTASSLSCMCTSGALEPACSKRECEPRPGHARLQQMRRGRDDDGQVQSTGGRVEVADIVEWDTIEGLQHIGRRHVPVAQDELTACDCRLDVIGQVMEAVSGDMRNPLSGLLYSWEQTGRRSDAASGPSGEGETGSLGHCSDGPREPRPARPGPGQGPPRVSPRCPGSRWVRAASAV